MLVGERLLLIQGEEYIDEWKNPRTGAVMYYCSLCACQFDNKLIISHAKGQGHRQQYLVHICYILWRQLPSCDSTTARSSVLASAISVAIVLSWCYHHRLLCQKAAGHNISIKIKVKHTQTHWYTSVNIKTHSCNPKTCITSSRLIQRHNKGLPYSHFNCHIVWTDTTNKYVILSGSCFCISDQKHACYHYVFDLCFVWMTDMTTDTFFADFCLLIDTKGINPLSSERVTFHFPFPFFCLPLPTINFPFPPSLLGGLGKCSEIGAL